jgi:hypothetical protein
MEKFSSKATIYVILLYASQDTRTEEWKAGGGKAFLTVGTCRQLDGILRQHSTPDSIEHSQINSQHTFCESLSETSWIHKANLLVAVALHKPIVRAWGCATVTPEPTEQLQVWGTSTSPSSTSHHRSFAHLTMSADSGVASIIAISRLAWSIYRSCKDAPKDFKDISEDVSRMHIVLKETDELVADLGAQEPIGPEKLDRLKHLANGCRDVLNELEELLGKFRNLGGRNIGLFDRLRFAKDDVDAIRDRIVANTVLLTAFNTNLQACVCMNPKLFTLVRV